MLIRFVEKFPGGRWIILLVPAILYAVGSALFSPAVVTQVANSVVLALSFVMVWTFRRSIPMFFREQQEAGIVWISLGIFSLVVTTLLNIAHSTVYRALDLPLDPNTMFISGIRFLYAFSFGCLYLVPLARAGQVPIEGWWSLFAVVVLTSIFSLLTMWLV